MTIHDFDMVRYLSGAEVEEVYAEGSVTVDPEIGKAGDIDTAIITLKLDNGATAVIDNCRAACYGYDQRAEVFGTKGCVAISNDSDSNAVYSCKDGVIAEKPMFFFLERYMMAYANEVDQFIEAIVNDTPTPVNAMMVCSRSSSASLLRSPSTSIVRSRSLRSALSMVFDLGLSQSI